MTHETGPLNDIEYGEDNPKSAVQESIAEGLATLSDASDSPTGVTIAPQPFTADDVNFETGTWAPRLASVQGWLNFESNLPEASLHAFVVALIIELGLAEGDGLDATQSGPSLSEDGLNALASRIDTARNLQQRFLDNLEAEGATITSATAAWNTDWEEIDDDEPISPEPVSAKAETWPIYQLVDSPLNLTPSYQRGDVWSAADRSALVESILRGIPLPSIILLKKKGKEPHEVVDGKQRLTAILRFVGAHPVAKQKLAAAQERHPDARLTELFHNDYIAFRRLWKNVVGETLTAKLENEYYFPFRLRKGQESALRSSLDSLQGKFYCEIKDEAIAVADEETTVEQLFTRPNSYKIPVIEYTKAEPRQIHEVFKLYNKQGVQLNAEEIRNAVYHELTLTPATLFAAGDVDPRVKASDIAPFLAEIPRLSDLGATLRGYGFGDARYKRTKVLSWIIAVLLNDTFDLKEGKWKPLTNTAKHIDQLLQQIKDDPRHPLTVDSTLSSLFAWISEAAELHASKPELWADSFKDGANGTKWQELQLVGSLVGVALALITSPDDVEERLDSNADRIHDLSATEWKRIEKTQTKTQWDYIRRIVLGLLKALDIDPDIASETVRKKYGSSGLESLRMMVLPADID